MVDAPTLQTIWLLNRRTERQIHRTEAASQWAYYHGKGQFIAECNEQSPPIAADSADCGLAPQVRSVYRAFGPVKDRKLVGR